MRRFWSWRTTWTSGTTRSSECIDFFLVFVWRLNCGHLFFIVIDVVGAVPQIIAVVFVGHPTAVFFIIVVVRCTAAATATVSQIVDFVISIRESVLLALLVSSRHARLLSGSVFLRNNGRHTVGEPAAPLMPTTNLCSAYSELVELNALVY